MSSPAKRGLRPRRRGHPTAWLVWTACALAAALLIRNPWHLMLLGGAALGARWRATGEVPARSTFILLASVMATSVAVSVLFSRAGATVLAEWPLPLIGGPYTLEAVAFGAVAGFQVGVVLLVMHVFSAVVTPTDLLRRVPAGLYPVGIVGMLGLTFAPLARRSYLDLAEARRLRGQPPQGMREARASVEPLLILSLEGAAAKAEGLVARGWGTQPRDARRRRLMVGGWVAMAIGFGWWATNPNQALLALGIAATGLALVILGARGLGTRYRADVWTGRDLLMLALSAAAGMALLYLSTRFPAQLSYYPYPQVTVPGFPLGPVIVVFLLSAPLAFVRRG